MDIVGADMARDMPMVAGGTPEALLREVISVSLLVEEELLCLPPVMASKHEQHAPMISVDTRWQKGRDQTIGAAMEEYREAGLPSFAS